MHFGKSPQHGAFRRRHSFQRSIAIANTTISPRRSAFSCSTTIAPRFERRELAPELEELGGGRRSAGAAISLPPWREVRRQGMRAANQGLSEDASRSVGAIPAWALKMPFGMRSRKSRMFKALRAQQSFRQSRARVGLAICRRQSGCSCWTAIGQKSIVWPPDTSHHTIQQSFVPRQTSTQWKGRQADRARVKKKPRHVWGDRAEVGLVNGTEPRFRWFCGDKKATRRTEPEAVRRPWAHDANSPRLPGKKLSR